MSRPRGKDHLLGLLEQGRGVLRLKRAAGSGRIEDFDDAIRLFRRAAERLGDELGLPANVQLSSAARARFEWMREDADLELAIAAARTALAAAPIGHPVRPQALDVLAVALIRQHENSDSPASGLDEMIGLLREALAAQAAPATSRAGRYLDSKLRPTLLADLGRALLTRSASDQDPARLTEAVSCFEAALALTADDDEQASATLASLGIAQRSRFSATGARSDLDSSVKTLRTAVNRAPANSPNLAVYVQTLANTLLVRYLQHEDSADLREALGAVAGVLESNALRAVHRPGCVATYGNLLRLRASENGDATLIDQAIDCFEQAQRGAAGRQERIGYLYALAATLATRHDLAQDRDDLSAAISTLRRLLADGPDPADLLLAQDLLASCLSDWADGAVDAQREQARQESLTLHRLAVERSPAGHVELPGRQSNLARTLWDRHTDTGSIGDADEAVRIWRQVAAEPGAAAPHRLRAARHAAGSAAQLPGGLAGSADDYRTAADLLALATWRGIGRPSQERILSESGGLAGDAAAAAVSSGSPAGALRLLEASRSVLWGQLTAAIDHRRLRQLIGDDRYERMQRVRAELDRPQSQDNHAGLPD